MSGGGGDTVTDFDQSSNNHGQSPGVFDHAEGDTIDLTGVAGIFTLDDVLSHVTSAPDDTNTVIDFGYGDTLTLQNVTLGDLVDNDFVFAIAPVNHAPVINLTPTITEVPIPDPLPSGADTAAVHEVAPAISFDGRWVAFQSDEINPNDNNNPGNNDNINHDQGDVLLYDRLTGVTTVLTDDAHIDSRPAGEHFSDSAINGSGSFVVFRGTYPTGNAPGDGPSSISNVYVYDRASDTTTELTNPANNGTPYTANDPVSIGGGHIVFVSDVGGGEGPPARHIYVTDTQGHIQTDITPFMVGITEPIDPDLPQTEFQIPQISANGQYLTFWTVAHTFDSDSGTNTQVGDATLYTYDRSNGSYQTIATTSSSNDDWFSVDDQRWPLCGVPERLRLPRWAGRRRCQRP